MKLLAALSKNHAIVSVGHHDFLEYENVFMDGGQPNLQNYAGYNRSNTALVWIEVPGVEFNDLFQDYEFNFIKRKYGVFPLSQVKILDESEVPDINSVEWCVDNFVWGTRGPKGDQPLKYILLKNATTEHLKALHEYPHASNTIKEVVAYLLSQRIS